MTEIATRTVDTLPPTWEAARLGQLLRAQLSTLHDRHHIEEIALFGSYVRNEQRPGSDLDVLVTFTQTPSLFGLMHVQDDLEKLLGVPVDVVMRVDLRPRLARYILAEAIYL